MGINALVTTADKYAAKPVTATTDKLSTAAAQSSAAKDNVNLSAAAKSKLAQANATGATTATTNDVVAIANKYGAKTTAATTTDTAKVAATDAAKTAAATAVPAKATVATNDAVAVADKYAGKPKATAPTTATTANGADVKNSAQDFAAQYDVYAKYVATLNTGLSVFG
jgi:hypothetical protein